MKGVDNNGFGFFWGGTKNTYHNYFYISGNGYFKIGNRKDNINEDICPWQISDFIFKGYEVNNILTIKVSENEIDFFINNQFVYSLNSLLNVYGNQFGLGADANVSFATNYIKISEK